MSDIIYEGNEDYIFISYSHEDDNILPIVEIMAKFRLRVWLDIGIEVGTEWPSTIEDHIRNCSVFLCFVSQKSMSSDRCLDEIALAREYKKEVVMLFMEENISLPSGIGLQTSRFQRVYSSRHKNALSLVQYLSSSDIFKKCCSSIKTPMDAFYDSLKQFNQKRMALFQLNQYINLKDDFSAHIKELEDEFDFVQERPSININSYSASPVYLNRNADTKSLLSDFKNKTSADTYYTFYKTGECLSETGDVSFDNRIYSLNSLNITLRFNVESKHKKIIYALGEDIIFKTKANEYHFKNMKLLNSDYYDEELYDGEFLGGLPPTEFPHNESNWYALGRKPVEIAENCFSTTINFSFNFPKIREQESESKTIALLISDTLNGSPIEVYFCIYASNDFVEEKTDISVTMRFDGKKRSIKRDCAIKRDYDFVRHDYGQNIVSNPEIIKKIPETALKDDLPF